MVRKNDVKIETLASLDKNVNKTKNQHSKSIFVEMVSFHELQELFLFSHDQGILDDDEMLLLAKKS